MFGSSSAGILFEHFGFPNALLFLFGTHSTMVGLKSSSFIRKKTLIVSGLPGLPNFRLYGVKKMSSKKQGGDSVQRKSTPLKLELKFTLS